MNPLWLTLIIGTILVSLTSFIPLEYCMDGLGWGLPLAIIHPHAGTYSIPLSIGHPKAEYAFDVLHLVIDFLVWSMTAQCVIAIWQRRRVRNDDSSVDTIHAPHGNCGDS
ncbi:MAG: hypothetical protein ACKVT0_18235 [Planctomycetaceae bacterium]